MKNILIVSHGMEIGGAERSLLGLLNSIDSKEYRVDLFLLHHEGVLFREIPQHINILPEISEYTVLARPIKKVVKEGHIALALARSWAKVNAIMYEKIHKFYDSGVALEYSHKYLYSLLPNIQSDKEYDMAISFLTPHYFVAHKVKAKKKMAWIHTDYSKVQINVKSELKMWSSYEYIGAISTAAKESFVKKFPQLEKKIIVIENILPVSLIKKQMKEFDPTDNEMKCEGIKLLSIGRYCTAKNFDNIPEICADILKYGVNVTWYIIGFGPDEELIKRQISEEHMENYVILLGKKENPYPYIKACDVYIQPSRYEGKSVAVREAQLLGKPVVITKYETSTSQLEHGIDGMIVPMKNKECAKQIVDLLKNNEKMKQLSNNCKMRDYSNQEEVKKIYSLIE